MGTTIITMKFYVVGETLVIERDEAHIEAEDTEALSLLQNDSTTDVLEVRILGESKDTTPKCRV